MTDDSSPIAPPPPAPQRLDRRLRRLFLITGLAALLFPVVLVLPRPRGPAYASGFTVGWIVRTTDGPVIVDDDHAPPLSDPACIGQVVLTLDHSASPLTWLPFSSPVKATWTTHLSVHPTAQGVSPPAELVDQIPQWFIQHRDAVPHVPRAIPDAAFLNGSAEVVLWPNIIYNVGLVVYTLAVTLAIVTWRTFRAVVADEVRTAERRCRGCGYAFTGPPAAICPECGGPPGW